MNQEFVQLLKGIFKLLGWGWTGEQFGIPINQIVQAIQQRENELIQENQSLRQRLSQTTLKGLKHGFANVNLSNQLAQNEKIISQLQEEKEQLQNKIGELEAQKPVELQPVLESTREISSGILGSQSQWLEVMPDFTRCLILGAPGSGKSATGHILLELHRWKAAPYILGFPKENEHLLPPWIGVVESFDKIPPASIVLVDEAYLLYHARKSGFDKDVQEMSEALGLARQREHSILFVAHEARHLDKNIVGYANLLVIKEPGIMDIKFERPQLREVLERARDFFQKTAGNRKGWSYVWSLEVDFEGPLETPLPSYWTDDLSRAYAGGISSPAQRSPSASREEKKEQAKAWREADFSYGKIAKALGVSKATIINWLKHAR